MIGIFGNISEDLEFNLWSVGLWFMVEFCLYRVQTVMGWLFLY